MSEIFDDEVQRRLAEVAASVAGMSEDEAVEALDRRRKQVERNGAALHRLSLAQVRGTLARALGESAEDEVISSLEELVVTIEASRPDAMPTLGAADRIIDEKSPVFDPELAGNVIKLLDRHRENAITILALIARASVGQPNPELVTKLESILTHDLEALTELEPR